MWHQAQSVEGGSSVLLLVTVLQHGGAGLQVVLFKHVLHPNLVQWLLQKFCELSEDTLIINLFLFKLARVLWLATKTGQFIDERWKPM